MTPTFVRQCPPPFPRRRRFLLETRRRPRTVPFRVPSSYSSAVGTNHAVFYWLTLGRAGHGVTQDDRYPRRHRYVSRFSTLWESSTEYVASSLITHASDLDHTLFTVRFSDFIDLLFPFPSSVDWSSRFGYYLVSCGDIYYEDHLQR